MTDGREDQWGILGNAVYLPDGTRLTKAKISSLLKSKFKAVSFRTNQKRGFRFNKLDIEKMSKQYEVVEEIVVDGITKKEGEGNLSKVLDDNKKDEKMVTEVTEVTDFKGVYPVYDNNTDTDVDDKKTFKIHGDEIDSENNKKANNNFINITLQNDNVDCKSICESSNNNLSTTPHSDGNDSTPVPEVQPISSISEKKGISGYKNRLELKNNQNKTYTPLKSVTSVTPVTNLPEYPCYFCGNEYTTYKDFDMELHLHEKHKDQLLKLPIGGNLDKREEYVIALTKKKMTENSTEYLNDEDSE